MIGTRHENYRHLQNDLPFVLQIDLERTPGHPSKQQNWHEDLEIQLCTGGQGTVLLNGEKNLFRPNDIVVINSNVMHYTFAERYLTYTCLIVSADFCKQVGIDYDALTFTPTVKSEPLVALFGELTAVYQRNDIPYRIAKLNDIALRLLIELAEHHVTKQSRLHAESKMFETVKAAITFIRERYAQHIALDDIAKAVLTDKYALCREFKKMTGQTVVEYIQQYRCMKAADYLAEGYCVAEAAMRCGFSNLSFFTKTFKKHIGKLPSDCKKHKALFP